MLKLGVLGIIRRFPVLTINIDYLYEEAEKREAKQIERSEAQVIVNTVFERGDGGSWITEEMFDILFRTLD